MNSIVGKIKQPVQALEEWICRHTRTAFILLAFALSLLAAMEYFTNLTFYSCFVDDEFQSSDAALAVAATGQTDYDRAFPATFLLAQWIKLFGFSEVSCRSLSGVYGVLAILSLVIITAKWFQSLGYTAIVGMMFLAEPFLTYYFRFTRMYSLAVLLCLWVYFLFFQGLEKHWGYLIPAFFLLWLSGQVHVNCLLPLGGVGVFILLKAVLTRKKMYLILSCAIVVMVLLGLLNYFVFRTSGSFFFNPGDLFGIVMNFVSIGGDSHFEYIVYFLRTSGSVLLSCALLVILIIFCIREKAIEDRMLYVACVSGFTIIFFWLLSDRYFAEQYGLMAVPFFLMLLGCAYLQVVRWKKLAGYGLMAGLMLFSSLLIGKTEYTFAAGINPKNLDYREAYGKIGDYYDLDAEMVPTIGSMVRTEYYGQIVPDYDLEYFDRSQDMDIWLDYGRRYSTGIVTVEWLKMPQLTQGVQDVILDWTDRISGEGVDDSGVNVSYYCFAEPDDQAAEHRTRDGVFWDEHNLYLVIDSEGIVAAENASGEKMLFVTLSVGSDRGETERHVGLYLPEEEQPGFISYTIPLDHLRGLDGSRIQNAELKELYLMQVE